MRRTRRAGVGPAGPGLGVSDGKLLKIAVMAVNFAPERSGIAPYTTKLATDLAARGHDVEVLTSRPHYPEWKVHPGYEQSSREHQGTMTIRRLRHYIPSSPGWIKRILFEISFGLRVLFSRWGKPDLVICVSPALIATAIISLRIHFGWNRPSSGLIVQDLYSRGVQEQAQKRGRLGRLAVTFESRVLRRFHGVVVIHDRFKAQLVRALDIPADQVSVIRNWNHVTPQFDCDVAEVRRSLGWGRETVVLHAGAMGVKQGLENVVAAARVAERQKSPVRFVLLGDGSQRASLAAAAKGLGNIEFRDQLDNEAFGRALVAADVLLVNESPGLQDMAVPSKLTSYFRAGKPIVAATEAQSTTAEELAAARAGVRVAPGRPEELVKAVMGLARNPRSTRAMAASGQEYCRSVLGEDVALDKYGDWVRRLGQERAAARRPGPASRPLAVPAQRGSAD